MILTIIVFARLFIIHLYVTNVNIKLIIIIIILPRGPEVPGGIWRGISSPLAARLKCTYLLHLLVHRAGQQGTCPPGRNYPGIEKCGTGINSSEDYLPGNQNQDIPNPEPIVIPPNKPPKAKRTRWTKEEYKTVLR